MTLFEGTGTIGDDEGKIDVFIIQITGKLMMMQAAGIAVTLTGGSKTTIALAKDIFWRVTDLTPRRISVLFMTFPSSLKGCVLAQTAGNLQVDDNLYHC